HDVADVIAFLRDQVRRPAALLGWSLGGVIATLVAAEAPELVRALILEDPPLAVLTDDDSSQAPFYEHFTLLRDTLIQNSSQEERRAALAATYPDDDDLLRRRRLKMYAGFDPEHLTLIIEKRKFEGNRLEEVLPRITCPVLLMQSDPSAGGALDDTTVQATVPLLTDCAHVRLQDVGHGIHNDQPILFSHTVINFLESL
ncbi:MAG: alpha/beta hydrolase, partial [Caldilineaceae bacterium]|nr:alpha/beta hydrolase [Caldilineaceae bacterium]